MRRFIGLGVLVLMLGGCGGSSTRSSSTRPTVTGLTATGGVRLVYRASVLTPGSPLGPGIEQAMPIMEKRLRALLPTGRFVLRRSRRDLILVDVPRALDPVRAAKPIGATARLEFYDWEADVVAPDGKTVASQLQSQDAAAIAISQGSGGATGSPGAGSQPLYAAVRLASRQPVQVSSDNARRGPQFYLFGAPGSSACPAAVHAQGKSVVAGQHCLLSGPENTQQGLIAGLASGVTPASPGVEKLTVPQGTAVVQAVPSSFAKPTPPGDPSAQFFVLHDHVSLFGDNITSPQQSTNSAGSPDVSFGFTSRGAKAFQSVTAAIARRGNLVSSLGQTLDQHFAVALDNQLITVPSIAFKTYPDGIPSDSGADITGGFTISSAQELAIQLRFGGLPVQLALISQKPF